MTQYRGQALTETVLLLPIFLVMLLAALKVIGQLDRWFTDAHAALVVGMAVERLEKCEPLFEATLNASRFIDSDRDMFEGVFSDRLRVSTASAGTRFSLESQNLVTWTPEYGYQRLGQSQATSHAETPFKLIFSQLLEEP